MSLKLSEGSLQVIMSGGNVDSPVMQILGCKKIASNNATERYRLLISDGKHHISFAMVATQLNDLVTNGDLAEFTVVKINRYITSMVNSSSDKEKRVMVILELTVIKAGNQVGVRIGNPVSLDPNSVNNQQPQPQQPQRMNNAAPQRSGGAYGSNQVRVSPGPNSIIHPIASLNPYQNRWTIKARVTNKQPTRTYTNARGEGKLFSVMFTDESGEIKCTGFNTAVDKFADLLEVNKVFMVSNCQLKPANKKFTQADYEMTFNDDSQIVPCADDVGLPTTVFNFIPISKVAESSLDSLVDVIGIATQVADVQTLISKNTGKELKKRDVTLVDQSNTSVSLTLWGTQAIDFDGSNEPVIAVKGVRLNEFMGGRSLSLGQSSTLQMNPDIPEAHRLRGWFDNGGPGGEIASISAKSGGTGSGGNWVLQGELTSQGLGLGDKADYFSGVVTVLIARHENSVYKACPSSDCKKKVMDMNNGQYRCEKCNRDYDHFVYRYLLSMQVSDYSGSSWVNSFHEEAQKLLAVDSQVIGESFDNKDDVYKEYFRNLAFKKFQMKFRTKMESYNDESRLKTTIVNADPVDYKAYARRLLADFKTSAGVSTGRN